MRKQVDPLGRPVRGGRQLPDAADDGLDDDERAGEYEAEPAEEDDGAEAEVLPPRLPAVHPVLPELVEGGGPGRTAKLSATQRPPQKPT